MRLELTYLGPRYNDVLSVLSTKCMFIFFVIFFTTVPMLRVSGVVRLLPLSPLKQAQENFTFYYISTINLIKSVHYTVRNAISCRQDRTVLN